jgi:pilus assembly protein CpaF
MIEQVRMALGPLALVVDDATRDLCVGGDGAVWVRDRGDFRATMLRLDPREARRVGVGLVELGGGRVDDAKPTGDSALAGSIRAHVVLPPIARDGALISLRFPRSTPIEPADYRGDAIDWGALASESTLICGPTGSGKSTLVETLLALCPVGERIVVLEDIAELVARHPHTAHLTTRAANAESAGEVTLRQLVREALRMSPDRIVVGEVRGVEIVDLFLALTSGHRGFATVHADGLEHLPTRLIGLGRLAGLDPAATTELAVAAFTRVVACEHVDDGVRIRVGRFVARHGQLGVES